ncbi:efflux RND transporter permease subunit [Natribacillus halophilus]|uniref:SSD domain-containing protein n=1 Tax=Natribacillus halophilus TaxID=549003 RepID=A0A1G8PEM5_9BACI|nr:MMPL family transporter [Natribacillus halophilus]SDI90954.1 hypothetical protein SAMN04488123_108100 [Natribacillus halophilus]
MALALISAVVQFAVPINHDMMDYLPDDAPSMEAMDVMDEAFDEEVTNTRVMIKDVSIQEALTYKEDLEAIDGVTDVMWLDDAMDMATPIEMADEDTVNTYYQDDHALFSFHIEEGEEVDTTETIYELIGEENAMEGDALDTAVSQEMTGQEAMFAAAILIPVIIVILTLATRSWIEPVFYLTAIGVSVLINLGTNIFIGDISFITQAVAPLLQLAVSLDYAIFLLHSFSNYRKETEDPTKAMQLAMKESFPAITACAATTFFGFMALIFMDFEIGADLGFNLVKGIFFSFISVIIFLPALTLMFYKWIDKTEHKPLLPSRPQFGQKLLKLRIPALIVVMLLIVPAFLAQSQTDFIYGMGDHPEDSRAGSDAEEIEEAFGQFTPVVLLVPTGDLAREEAFVEELDNYDVVDSIISYVTTVGAAIPPEYLDESETEQFFSDDYSQLILNTSTDTEGDEAFAFVEEVRGIASDYYGDKYHLTGESATLYDMKDIVEQDNTLVNTLTIIVIGTILLITFRSISFPVVLLLTIQASVWINLAIPYFTGSSLVYIGYLIISTIQLAATVDYGILLTENYNENRKEMSAMDAIKKSLNEKIFPISVSAAILASVGFILWVTSTDPIVASIGLLLGRGALLAFLMVVLLLPGLLLMLDRVIEKTTWKPKFYKGGK